MDKHITKRELDWYTDVDGNIIMRIFQTYEDNELPLEAFHGIFQKINERYELHISEEALHDCMELHVNKNSDIMEIKSDAVSFRTSLTDNSAEWINFVVEPDESTKIVKIIANDKQYVIDALKTFKPMIDFVEEA